MQSLMLCSAVELKRCSDLREVSLESNRLNTPVMDLRALSQLESLQLYGNPLQFLPELSPCTNLRHLSLANVRIAADEAFTHWDVEVTATSYISRGNKLAQLFALIFRRSSCQQPLLAGALGNHMSRPLFLGLDTPGSPPACPLPPSCMPSPPSLACKQRKLELTASLSEIIPSRATIFFWFHCQSLVVASGDGIHSSLLLLPWGWAAGSTL